MSRILLLVLSSCLYVSTSGDPVDQPDWDVGESLDCLVRTWCGHDAPIEHRRSACSKNVTDTEDSLVDEYTMSLSDDCPGYLVSAHCTGKDIPCILP